MSNPIGRHSIGRLMAIIGLMAIGLAAMRDGSPIITRVFFTATLTTLALGLLGAIVRRGEPSWVGFTLFGLGFLAINNSIGPSFGSDGMLVSGDLIQSIITRLHQDIPRPEIPLINLPSNLSYDQIRTLQPSTSGVYATLSPAEKKILADFQAVANAGSVNKLSTTERRFHASTAAEAMLALLIGAMGAVAAELLKPRGERQRAPLNPAEVHH